MKQRLIDANALHWRIGVDQDDKQIFYVTGEDIDFTPTIYPENLRPMGWWRYNKENRSWNCGQCGWRNPLMPPDGPSPDGEQFSGVEQAVPLHFCRDVLTSFIGFDDNFHQAG